MVRHTGNKIEKMMKKNIFFVSMLAMTLGFVACSSEDDVVEQATQTPTQPQSEVISFIATGEACTGDETGAKATRTQLGSDGKSVVWSDGDQIFINGLTFTLNTTDAGKTQGEFTTEGKFTTATKYDALYGIRELTLPVTQVYSAKKISNAPMRASVEVTRGGRVGNYTYTISTNPVKFMNLCGLLRLTLKGTDGVRTIKEIEISADQIISGSFKVMSNSASMLDGVNYVILDCGDGVVLNTNSSKDFYISLPPANYTGVKITIRDTEGYECVKTLKDGVALTITRSMITPAGFSTSFTSPVTQPENNSQTTTGSIGGYEYVDLGTGVLWASKNIGASKETDNGNYYSWGETNSKARYASQDYTLTFNEDTKYTETVNGVIHLKSAYDVAQTNWGNEWRMPTKKDIVNLVNECYWEYDSKLVGYYVYRAQKDANGRVIMVNGKKVKDTTRPENERIFLPCAKYYNGDKLYSGSYGYYWSSTPADGIQQTQNPVSNVAQKAYCYKFATSAVEAGFTQLERWYGMTVRPVHDYLPLP